MESIRRGVSGIISDNPTLFVISGVFCFSAGWLAANISRNWPGFNKFLRRADKDILNVSAGGGVLDAYSKRAARRATAEERRLARLAAHELIRVLKRQEHDVRERDGQGFRREGGEVDTGLGNGDIYFWDGSSGTYDSEDCDYTF
ncbi:b38.5 [Murid betaherpesvirus 8]|uniref:B38.5 n=3 Tax=Muromegalovirus TaxID=10365 RepID=K7XXU3_RCMVE|nr:e38.5 [Murid betaherpesvirus 8]ABZ01583.1 e38.5 [Murid betaherpesvirus 2]AKE44215.1 a38.5 [Rat cytomegalovirus ALL-03]AFX83360.1 e38.5 [Murid betaherpesvirus 8]AKB93240.1 b38.5 [Murid betaherpesvirus 8]WEG71832.1 protein m38.5 [Murid betaherpesvirus 8]